jgi:hypothetical protein
MTLTIIGTPYSSVRQGALPEGCQSCVKGEKLVLFVTGACPVNCFFCPLSEARKHKDVIFANEHKVVSADPEEQLREVIAEAESHDATGAGVTGGDPLVRIERTVFFIKGLKAHFGKKFHIHLYTPLHLVDKHRLRLLADAGLDEIRFHPELDTPRYWERLRLARRHTWQVGIEIPVFPDKIAQTMRLVDFVGKDKLIDFLNLNELELIESTAAIFKKRGYKSTPGGDTIDGSRRAALMIMRHAKEYHLPAHFCTARLKDRIQVGNRIIRRAKKTATPFDLVDDEGLLTRGVIYWSYPPKREHTALLSGLTKEQREEEIGRLKRVMHWLNERGMPHDAGALDTTRLRILLSAEALHGLWPALHKAFPVYAAISTEYPTSDCFAVRQEFLPVKSKAKTGKKRATKRK